MEIIKAEHEPNDYSIVMNFDIKNDSNLPLHLELYNIGGLLSKNGILYRIIIFYSFCSKVLQGEEINSNEKQIRITECLKAIDNDNIKYLKTLSKIEIGKQFFNLIKSGFNKVKNWFPRKYEPIRESLLKYSFNAILKTIIIPFTGSVVIISGLALVIIGIIGLIKGKSIQNDINDYIKRKNLINLEIILEKIKTIFMDENKALDFFRNNNIYSLAYDSSITYYKNAGAAFFPYNIEGLGKKARKLIKDSEVGFDTDNDADENSIYECYEKNILEIIRFFKDTRDNFNNILQNEGNFNDNDDIKQIVNHLVEVNERAVNEYGDIITTTNITNDSVNETLLNNNINDNVLDNKQKSIPDEESKLIIKKDDEEKENLKNKINELEEKLSEEKKSNEINIKKK